MVPLATVRAFLRAHCEVVSSVSVACEQCRIWASRGLDTSHCVLVHQGSSPCWQLHHINLSHSLTFLLCPGLPNGSFVTWRSFNEYDAVHYMHTICPFLIKRWWRQWLFFNLSCDLCVICKLQISEFSSTMYWSHFHFHMCTEILVSGMLELPEHRLQSRSQNYTQQNNYCLWEHQSIIRQSRGSCFSVT
jgi:hypothetical protein